VQWLLNGKRIATSPANVPIEHRTAPARHRLLALDARGACDAVEVRVLSQWRESEIVIESVFPRRRRTLFHKIN